jgi:endonuclease/exonuclease/phosphatase family metal-dependent hydrolase
MILNILTINIAGLQFHWSEGRRESLINQIITLNPDIVFLQETTVVPDRKYDQTLDLAKELNFAATAFTPYGNHKEYESPRLGGIGILSRWPFQFVQNRKLPAGTLDQYGARSGLIVSIRPEKKDILLATTHLSYRPEEEDLRLHQCRELLKAISLYPHEEIVIGGDFNAKDHEGAIKEMSMKFKDSGDRGVTFKNRRIDYVFYSGLELIESRVVLNEEKPVLPSDHFGVFCKMGEKKK